MKSVKFLFVLTAILASVLGLKAFAVTEQDPSTTACIGQGDRSIDSSSESIPAATETPASDATAGSANQ